MQRWSWLSFISVSAALGWVLPARAIAPSQDTLAFNLSPSVPTKAVAANPTNTNPTDETLLPIPTSVSEIPVGEGGSTEIPPAPLVALASLPPEKPIASPPPSLQKGQVEPVSKSAELEAIALNFANPLIVRGNQESSSQKSRGQELRSQEAKEPRGQELRSQEAKEPRGQELRSQEAKEPRGQELRSQEAKEPRGQELRSQVIPSSPPPSGHSPSHLSPTLETLFQGNENSLVAIAIGSAEGTRTTNGDKTAAYWGHIDPGNGVWNLGSFSYQHGADSPEAADRQQMQRLWQQAIALQQQAAAQQLTLSLEALLNGIDLANQAPQAALSTGGYIDRLVEAERMGLREAEAIQWARVRSFLDPDTRQWNAPGLGNQVSRISGDQARRMAQIWKVLVKH